MKKEYDNMTKSEFIKLVSGYLNQPEIEETSEPLYIDSDKSGDYLSLSFSVGDNYTGKKSIEISMYDNRKLVMGRTTSEMLGVMLSVFKESYKTKDKT